MLLEVAFVLLAVTAQGANAALCAACTKSGSDCTALKAYIACLDVSTDGPCPLTTAQVAAVVADTTCDSSATESCKCQIAMFRTEASTDALKCSQSLKALVCLGATKDVSCDASVGKVAIAGIYDGYQTAKCTATPPTDTCTCQIALGKADTTDDDKLCTETKKALACMSVTKGLSCDAAVTKHAAAATLETRRSGITVTATCTAPTATCTCQINAAKADASSDTMFCSALGDLSNCYFGIATASEASCVAATDKTAATTALDTVRGAAPCSLKSCATCTTEYGTAKTAATANAGKCTALSAYIKCLESASDQPHLCLSAVNSAAIVADYTSASCSFTGTCMCQKALWGTDITANNAAQCTAIKTGFACLMETTDYVGCTLDKKSWIATEYYNVLTALTSLSSTDCPALTATCTCAVNGAKAVVTDKTTYCAALKALGTCLTAVTDGAQVGCKAGDTKTTLATKQATLYQTALCSADHVTFVLTSLLACLFVTFSL